LHLHFNLLLTLLLNRSLTTSYQEAKIATEKDEHTSKKRDIRHLVDRNPDLLMLSTYLLPLNICTFFTFTITCTIATTETDHPLSTSAPAT
jgi:hypothetical protein